VAGLQAQQSGEVEESTADGMTPLRQLAAISERALELTTESYRIWNALRPELRREGVALVSASELDAKEQATLDEYFTKEIFPQLRVIGQYAFRVTRNFDLQIDDEEGEDLLRSLQAELRRRERGEAVRLEVSGSAPQDSLNWLCRALELDPGRDVYNVDGPLFLGDMT